MSRIFRSIILLVLLIGLVQITPAHAQEQPLAAQVRALTFHAKEGIEAAEQNKPDIARAEYQEIDAIWESFEDRVREKDPAGYVEIESALAAIKAAVSAQTLDMAAVRSAYEQLEHEADEVADRLG